MQSQPNALVSYFGVKQISTNLLIKTAICKHRQEITEKLQKENDHSWT